MNSITIHVKTSKYYTLYTCYWSSAKSMMDIKCGDKIIAVCTYCLVMISIERSKTAQKSALEIRDKFSLKQNAVQDKIQSENFFPD